MLLPHFRIPAGCSFNYFFTACKPSLRPEIEEKKNIEQTAFFLDSSPQIEANGEKRIFLEEQPDEAFGKYLADSGSASAIQKQILSAYYWAYFGYIAAEADSSGLLIKERTDMRYLPIPSQLFADRRRSFGRQMKRNAIAIFYSNEAMPKTGDQFYPFRQDSSLFALSGLDQIGSILVLFPGSDNTSKQEIAFILPQDPRNTIWNGDRLTFGEARKISGIRSIYSTDQWDKIMSPMLRKVKTVYTNTHDDHLESGLLLNDRMRIKLKNDYPSIHFHSAKPILRKLLMVKHPLELTLMNKAISITAEAFHRVLRTIRPGMKEFEVEAELTYILARHGCQHAFEPIVASGKSACTLHYVRNDKLIKKDDLVLIDFGAEYACMASDMTRTIPASGIFTKRQKQIYSAVQSVLEEISSMMRPGITLAELNKETRSLIDRALVQLKIVSKRELKNQDPANPLRQKYFMHGVSHHLGYDVHDQSDPAVPLKAGMVLTCEPALYIPEENIGIRLENDILVTRGNPKNLMADVPIDPEHIEEIIFSSRKQEAGERR